MALGRLADLGIDKAISPNFSRSPSSLHVLADGIGQFDLRATDVDGHMQNDRRIGTIVQTPHQDP